jgi:hypothetical protein
MMVVGQDGFLDHEESFNLYPSQSPKGIDVTYRPSDITSKGIYELVGDTLKICYGEGKRPTEFPTEAERTRILKRVSRTCAPVAQRFANAPGCFWIDEPRNPGVFLGLGGPGVSYLYEKDKDGAAVITMAYLTPDFYSREYRPVIVDAGKNRYLPKCVAGGSAGRRGEGLVALSRWRLDPVLLPADHVAGVGIEAVTADAHRSNAREAQKRARIAKVEVLPWPQLGAAYPFTLTAIDGRKIRSEDFKGKVLVIHCWATSSYPYQPAIVRLKALYAKWHSHGLEIVGVNFDQDIETLEGIRKSETMTWPQVFVPNDDGLRQLWREACGAKTMSSVLLIDQRGILRGDATDKLEEKIAKLLASRAENPPAKLKP